MLRDKLSSESGATLILALVFFLLCAVAGSVILVAGSGAAGRLADVKDDQQAYYSVTSAARLMKAEIAKQEYAVNTVTGAVSKTGKYDASKKAALEGLIKQGLQTVKTTQGKYEINDCTLESNDNSKLNVKFDFSMDTGYAIKILIKKIDSTGDVQYQCTLKARSTVANSNSIDDVQWDIEQISISK